MEKRFIRLWEQIRAQSNPKEEFAKLQLQYSQPHRFYHTIRHIGNCLSELDSATDFIQEPDLVELAVWYHDAIYDTQNPDNEEKSAQLAYDICLLAKLPESFAEAAKEMILATKHSLVPKDKDTGILVDIDLSILGKPSEEFDEYERNIRKEYAWVSEEKFREGRRAILRRFLSRDSVYSTEFFKGRYETQAKFNLQRSIEALI